MIGISASMGQLLSWQRLAWAGLVVAAVAVAVLAAGGTSHVVAGKVPQTYPEVVYDAAAV
jgi:hypothetical protein